MFAHWLPNQQSKILFILKWHIWSVGYNRSSFKILISSIARDFLLFHLLSR